MRTLLVSACLALLPATSVPARGDGVEVRFLPDAREEVGAGAREIRSILVRRCAEAPAIDGSLDDEAWKHAQSQGGFVILKTASERMLLAVVGSLETGAAANLPAARPVDVRLVYDDARLYVGFEVDEPGPDSVRREHRENDNRLLWQDDTVEMILDPDADRKRYFHFMINANGNVTDGEFGPGIGRLERIKWTSRWECASRLADGKWTVEFAVPFEDLRVATPHPGATWLGNFGHGKTAPFQRDLPNGMTVQADGEFSSWMGVDKQYHEPWNFGEIVFDRPPAVRIVSLDWNEPAWGRNVASVTLRNREATPLFAEVRVAGLTAEAVRVDLAPGKERALRVPFVIDRRTGTAPLTLEARADGQLLASRQTEVVLASEILEARAGEEVLWEGETAVPVDFRLHVGVDTLPHLKLEIRVGDRSALVPVRTRRGTVVVPVAGQGDVSMTVTLRSAGEVVAARPLNLKRYANPLAW